jgi:hypothetical protein
MKARVMSLVNNGHWLGALKRCLHSFLVILLLIVKAKAANMNATATDAAVLGAFLCSRVLCLLTIDIILNTYSRGGVIVI